MSIKRILTVAVMSCVLFIIDAAASDYGKCMKEAEKYLSKEQYEEYISAMKKCAEIQRKELEKLMGTKILENANSLNEALKKPDRIGRLQISLSTDEKIEQLPGDFAKLVNMEELTIFDINARAWGNVVSRFDVRDAMNKISKISNLKVLDLEGDLKAEDIKDDIKNLKQLKTLRLKGINGFPTEIGNLINLEELYLEGKEISAVPSVIGNLGRLIRLTITKTNITTLPEEVGRLKNLQYLNLSQNKLTSLPPSMMNLIELKELEIRGNPVVKIGQWEEVL